MNSTPEWPPVPGDFEVKNPNHCVAICTLGKKIEVRGEYAIIGTCKTENIGIERVIINTISNPNIRFLILAGPEVPGHLTGRTFRALFHNGVDSNTRKIVDAEGAIPYIENVTLEGIERFRQQVELIELINTLNPDEISKMVTEAQKKNPGSYPEDAMWIEIKVPAGDSKRMRLNSDILLLPEYNLVYDHITSLVSKYELHGYICENPTAVAIEVRTSDSGTILVGKEA